MTLEQEEMLIGISHSLYRIANILEAMLSPGREQTKFESLQKA